MLRAVSLSALFAAGLFLAPTAQAIPVVDVLDGQDGNFRFSVVHTSTGGDDGQSGSILGSVGLGDAGGDWSVVGDLATLTIELDINVGGNVSSYDAVGDFRVSALTEFSTNLDVMIGSLALSLTAGADESAVDGLTFYFENRNYSTAGDPPNGLELDPAGDVLTLWGATAFTGSGVIDQALDLMPAADSRGIDLRIQMAPPIPEPGAKPLYLAGLAVVGFGASRLRRR